MPPKKVLLVMIAIGVLAVAFVTPSIAATFEIGVSDAIETPERTVESDEVGEHTIDAVAVSHPDETISVSVTVPSEGTHFLDLYKEDRIETIRLDDGSETVEVSTDGLDPGSYVLRLRSDGTTEDIHPVVVEGYDLTTSHPSTVDSGDDVTVEVTLTEQELTGEPAGGLEVIVWNDDTAERVEATQSGELTYTATIDSSQLDETTYKIYAIAQSDEEYQGENEIVGMSRNAELTVEPNTKDDDSSDNDSSDNDSSDDDSTDDSETNDDSTGDDSEDSSTDDDSADDSETNDGSTEDDGTDDGSTDSADGDDDSGDDGDGSTDDESTDSDDNSAANEDESDADDEEDNSSVIEPNTDNESNQDDSETTNDDGTVPLSIWIAVIAIVAGVLALRSTLTE